MLLSAVIQGQESTYADSRSTAYDFSAFEKRGFHKDSVQNHELFLNISKWFGTRYRYAGRSKKGVDCSGFVKAVLDSAYSIKFQGGSASIHKQVTEIDRKDLKEGDLVFFYTRNKKRVNHISIYIGNNKIAHSAIGKGVTISDLDEPWYARHYFSSGRIENLQVLHEKKSASHHGKALLYK